MTERAGEQEDSLYLENGEELEPLTRGESPWGGVVL